MELFLTNTCRYLVERRWYEQWKEYVVTGDQNSSSFPGQIDNTELFEELDSYHLKERLVENEDFVLIPAEAWRNLLAWYGMVDDQPALERKVVDLPSTVKIEVYPVEIFLCLHSNMENVVTAQFSRADHIHTIQKVMMKQFDVVEGAETRLWMKSSDTCCERLRNVNVNVLDSSLSSGMTVIMEMRNEDGTWPSSRPQIMNVRDLDYYGLSFMSTLCFSPCFVQCLSNTPPLTEYFLQSAYLEELNFTNPLGMKGEIAEAYADVIKQMWSGRHYSVVPRLFKTKVGHFASQFLGYQQHDSQELLSFLLDGLHEDLNRVKNKEYIELRDADGRPDQEVAEEAWHNHQRRNNSVIVDTFHGLFKSTLVCPECRKVSVTFDPFCYLSVPLPVSKDRVMEVFFVYLDPVAKPVQHRLVVPKAGKVFDLCSALSEMTNLLPPHQKHTFSVFSCLLVCTRISPDPCLCCPGRYELSSGSVEEEEGDEVVLALYLRERSHYRDSGSGSSSCGTSLFGHPLLMAVPRVQCSRNALYHLFLQRLARYVRPPDPSEEDEDDEELYKIQTNGVSDGNLISFSKFAGASAGVPTNSQQGAGLQQQQPCHTEEEEEKGECPPQTNERQAKRKGYQARRRKLLFSIHAVNSNGTTERGMGEDGSAFSFSSQPYVAIDWDPDMKKKCYNENEAEKYVKHQSMEVPHQQTTVQLQECIELFTTVEILEEENPWYCPICKKHQLATKKLDLWSLPEVLIIHLKRFSYTKYSREKLDIIVDFPLRHLDFSGCLLRKTGTNGEPPSRYDLIAVSNHYGGLRDGHYTSYARNKDNGQWYYFDDNKVTYAREEQIVTNAAYLLFYHRQDKIRQPTLPPPSDSSSSPTQPANVTSHKHDGMERAISCVNMETD
uniref:ubiquitinyl hydrolase 1 n=1 Tax=Oncorhynchus tshawytscha TaxID=74940 RepID=A0A8C8DEH9_ONCTS